MLVRVFTFLVTLTPRHSFKRQVKVLCDCFPSLFSAREAAYDFLVSQYRNRSCPDSQKSFEYLYYFDYAFDPLKPVEFYEK